MGTPCHSMPLCFLVPRGAEHTSDFRATAGHYTLLPSLQGALSTLSFDWKEHQVTAVLKGVQCVQAAKRLMAGIPTSSHRLSLSPYLDAKLFMYDERLIEADLRLRTYSEQALKFTSLAHPNACRFKVRTCWCGRIDIASASKAYIGILCLWPYGPSSDRPSHCRCNQLLRRPIRTSRHPGISGRWWPMSSILSSPWCSACCTLQRTQRSSLSTTEHEQLLAEEHPWRCRVSPLKSALMSLCSDEWLRAALCKTHLSRSLLCNPSMLLPQRPPWTIL